MMKLVITIITLAFLISCKSKNDKANEKSENIIKSTITEVKNEHTLSKKTIDSLTIMLDSILEKKMLIKYHYPDMSMCGGNLYGYFKDSTLLITKSTYLAELGFVKRKIYWYNDNIIKIIHHKHSAEWTKYQEKYPLENYDADKMTYTDTIYQINFADKSLVKKIAGKRIMYVEQDTALLNRLITCAFRMKEELQNKRVSEN